MPNYSAELPWLNVQLNEICSKPQYGYTTKASNIGQVKFLRTTDITKGQLNWDSVPYCESPPDDILKYQLKDRDIVISRAGSIGFSCLLQDVPEPSVFASYLIRFEPSIYISEIYLKRFLESHDYWSQLALMSAGNAIQNVNAQKLAKISLPLPPLAEQKVIADKLDTLLAKVEAAKEHLERISEILKTFRQSILTAAVSGKLTEGWRNRVSFSTKKGALGDFVSIDIGHAFKSKEFSDSGVRLLRGQNIEPGSLKWDETRYFPKEKLEDYSHLFIRANDIILAMDRPIISTGLKLARAKEQDLPCVLVQRVARFTDFNGLTPDFLFLLLDDIAFTNYIQPNQTGSDIPHISGKQILSYQIKVPTIAEQSEIVHRAQKQFAFADSIEQKVKTALERVNNLTQSILAKAFRGELTAEWRTANPELISVENSAKALLKKIKIERETLKKQPRARIVRKKKENSILMANKLINVLAENSDWITAQRAFHLCGVTDGTSTDRIEELYSELRDLDKAGRLQVDTIHDDQGRKLYDRLKLIGV